MAGFSPKTRYLEGATHEEPEESLFSGSVVLFGSLLVLAVPCVQITAPYRLSSSSSAFGIKQFYERLGRRRRGSRILAGDKQAVDFDMRRPVVAAPELAAALCQARFDQKRDNPGQPDRFFLAVGEAGHPLARYDIAALGASTSVSAAGAWHTAATGLLEPSMVRIRSMESRSWLRSHSGPCPPG